MILFEPTDIIHTSPVSCVSVFVCVCLCVCHYVSTCVSVYASVCVHMCAHLPVCLSVWMCVYKCMYDVERQLCFYHTSVQGQSLMGGSVLTHESKAEAEEKPSSPPSCGALVSLPA